MSAKDEDIENGSSKLLERERTYTFFNGLVEIDVQEAKVIAIITVIIIIPLLIGVIVAFQTPLGGSKGSSPNYKIWCVGHCNVDVQTVTTPGAILMGGK